MVIDEVKKRQEYERLTTEQMAQKLGVTFPTWSLARSRYTVSKKLYGAIGTLYPDLRDAIFAEMRFSEQADRLVTAK